MTFQFSDDKYYYTIESSGDWARAEIRELNITKQGDEIRKSPGKRLFGADTGSGYVGIDSGTQQRHAPELAREFIASVKLSCEHAANGKVDHAEIERQMARIRYAVLHADQPVPDLNKDLTSQAMARIGGSAKLISPTLSKVGNQYDAPDWAAKIKAEAQKSTESEISV